MSKSATFDLTSVFLHKSTNFSRLEAFLSIKIKKKKKKKKVNYFLDMHMRRKYSVVSDVSLSVSPWLRELTVQFWQNREIFGFFWISDSGHQNSTVFMLSRIYQGIYIMWQTGILNIIYRWVSQKEGALVT